METKDDSLTQRVLRALDGRPFGKKEMEAVCLCDAAESLLYACLHAEAHAEFTDSAWVHIPLESMDRIRDAIAKARSF